jgi:glutamate carboxypeptidase
MRMSLTPKERDACARIEAWRQRMVDELAAWVAIPTGRGHVPGLHRQRALLAARLRSLGAVTHDEPCEARPAWIDPPWAHGGAAGSGGAGAGGHGSAGVGEGDTSIDVLVAKHDGPGPRLLLSGHFDTVHDPHGAFRALVDVGGGRAQGPGAADMKGGLVIALAALEAIRDAGVPLSWTFVLTPDEETGSFGSAAALARVAPGHAAGFVFEPAGDGDSLVVERMGAGQFMIEATGRAAHAGRDYAKGVSAVRVLCERVLQAERASDAAAGRIVNVGPLQGGAVTNAVPDRARAWGNLRFADAVRQTELEHAIDALASGGDDEVPRVRVRRVVGRPAKPLTPAVERLAALAREASEDLGRPLPFAKSGGVCDGNNLQAAGLPVIDTLGVRGGNLHRTDEWVDLDGLVDRAQLVALVLMRARERILSNP